MRKLGLIIASLTVISIAMVPLLGCSTKPATAQTSGKIQTVQRGNLVVTIPATGNLQLSNKQDLAFDIVGATSGTTSGTAGDTVAEVMVKTGDSVKKGQTLARLDASERAKAIKVLQRTVTSREGDISQAEINLVTAQDALDKAENPYTDKQISDARYAVDQAQRNLDEANRKRLDDFSPYNPALNFQLANGVTSAEKALRDAQYNLGEMLSGSDPNTIASKKLQLNLAQAKLDQARQLLDDAKETLANSQNASLVITAPFDGLITAVNIAPGDIAKANAVAMTIADPTKFQTQILVNEMDIPKVKAGAKATIQLNAVTGVTFSANVTWIAPTATVQSGVVNFPVKITLELAQPSSARQSGNITQQFGSAGQSGNTSQRFGSAGQSGNTSQRFGSAGQSGNTTQRFGSAGQSGNTSQPSGSARLSGNTTQPSFAVPAQSASSGLLKEGMTLTASIIVQEKQNVLLVPNQAIIRQGRSNFVKVVTGNTTDTPPEQRAITVGISNLQYTEVTEGLSEGEQILISQTTTSTTTRTQQNRPSGGMFGIIR